MASCRTRSDKARTAYDARPWGVPSQRQKGHTHTNKVYLINNKKKTTTKTTIKARIRAGIWPLCAVAIFICFTRTQPQRHIRYNRISSVVGFRATATRATHLSSLTKHIRTLEGPLFDIKCKITGNLNAKMGHTQICIPTWNAFALPTWAQHEQKVRGIIDKTPFRRRNNSNNMYVDRRNPLPGEARKCIGKPPNVSSCTRSAGRTAIEMVARARVRKKNHFYQ